MWSQALRYRGFTALYLVQVAIVLCQVCVDGDIGAEMGP